VTRILKAEFAYNFVLLAALLVIVPIISLLQLFGTLNEMEFIVPLVGFLMINGVVQRLVVEKRITRLSQIPVTPADVGIFRALIALIPFLIVIAINIMLNFAFGFTAYTDYKTILTATGFYINFYFAILILLDLFSNYPKKGALSPNMKIKMIAMLIFLAVGFILFFKLSVSSVIAPVYLEFLLSVLPFSFR